MLGYDGPVKLWIAGECSAHDPHGVKRAVPDILCNAIVAGPGTHEIILAMGTREKAATGVYLRFERIDLSWESLISEPVSYRMPVIF